MSWLRKLANVGAATRIIDEELYAKAYREMSRGIRRDGLWAKALANGAGDESRATALYLQYRVQAYKDELALLQNSEHDALQARNIDQRTPPSPALQRSITSTRNDSSEGSVRVFQSSEADDDAKTGQAERLNTTPIPNFPDVSTEHALVPSWAADDTELKSFFRSVSILAVSKDVSRSYLEERTSDESVRTSVLNQLALMEKEGATYMDQVSATADHLVERWTALSAYQRKMFLNRDQ